MGKEPSAELGLQVMGLAQSVAHYVSLSIVLPLSEP